jgi:ribosomal 50S subunit-associated protein YjgA (DUF615 family)
MIYIKNLVAKYYFQQRSVKSNRRKDINLETRKRKFRWIGHTLRKEDGEIPKAALLWNPQGNRETGRPRNNWRRSVIKEGSRSWNALMFLPADRQKWKGLIATYVSRRNDGLYYYYYYYYYYYNRSERLWKPP